jgi:1-aminocyclopropane-1-carboxylate deaminase/D-cysteine desulfhydrase-like pyridoxal-dependent ACC family enzyme
MPSPTQSQKLTAAVASIRSAETALLNQGRQTVDPLVAAKISQEYQALDSILFQAVQAQLITDDGVFQNTVVQFHNEAAVLNKQAQAISNIIADAGTAGTIAGFIVQAAAAFAAL